MNKYKPTELEILNERIKYEKEKVYSNGITLLPGLTTLTLGALAENQVCMAIGTIVTLGGAILSSNMVNTKKFWINSSGT